MGYKLREKYWIFLNNLVAYLMAKPAKCWVQDLSWLVLASDMDLARPLLQ